MDDDQPGVESLAPVVGALLRWLDQARDRRTQAHWVAVRVAARLSARLRLEWVVMAWLLARSVVGAAWGVATGRAGRQVAAEQDAARLYGQCSGKGPRVAATEIGQIGQQLLMLDAWLGDWDWDRRGVPGGGRAALAAAAAALVGFYLAGCRTDDELFGAVQAAWVAWEVVGAQPRPPVTAAARGLTGRRRAAVARGQQVQVALGGYRAAWQRWLEGQGMLAGPSAG